MPLREVKYGWIDVDKIIVPPERYWGRLDEEELEAMREAIREHGPESSLEHPITVCMARRTNRYVLRDGFNRLQIFRELGHRRIYAIAKIFDDEGEALEDARWGSIEDNWHRSQRDPRQLITLIRGWTAGIEEAAKLLIEKGFSRSYAYKLAAIAKNPELSEKVAKGELPIYKAAELIAERKTQIVSHMRQPEEKPGKGVISVKEALSEEQKIAQIRRGRISAKEAGKTDFSEKPRRGRPRKEVSGLSARLRDALERAFNVLNIRDEAERERLTGEAAEALGGQPTEIQVEAVKRWRESGGKISFKEALKRVLKPPKLTKAEAMRRVLEIVEETVRKTRPHIDERGVQDFVEDARKFFGKVEPELALEAAKVWRSGHYTYPEALEEAKRRLSGGEEEPEEEHEGIKCPRCGAWLQCPECGWW